MDTVERPKLRPKMKRFARAYVENGGNGTQAVKQAGYNVANDNVARSIGTENLTKPAIQAEIKALGFDADSAKSVVREIMADGSIDPNARLRATDQVFKVVGAYAPEKTLNVSVEMVDDGKFAELMMGFDARRNALEQPSEKKVIEASS